MASFENDTQAHVFSYSSDMQGYVGELESIGRRPVRSVKDIDKMSADMDAVFAKMRTRTNEYANVDLAKQYRDNFRSAFNVPMGKRNSDISYRIRKGVIDAGNRSINDLQTVWKQRRLQAVSGQFGRGYYQDRIKKLRGSLESGGLSPSQKKKARQELEQAVTQFNKFSKGPAGSAFQEPTVIRRYRKGKKKGKAMSAQPADRYYQMLAKTGDRQVATRGYLEGLAAGYDKEKKWVLVTDGPDCGWETHRSSKKANGLIVPVSEALKYPLAHPNCQRAFRESDGPPGSKASKRQMKELFGVTSQAQLMKIAKAAAIVGKTAGAAAVVGQSPFVRGFVRDILSDKEIRVPEFAQKILRKWVDSYKKKEAFAIGQFGQGLDEFSFRSKIMNGIDNVGLDADFLSFPSTRQITIGEDIASALGLDVRVTKGRFLEAAEDYADWVRWQRGEALDALENIAEQALEAEVRAELYGEAAIRYNLHAVRSPKLSEQLRNISRVYTDAISKRPDRIGIEAVRAGAALLDPLPWLGVRQGNFRFMVGLTSDGRRDLAEFLYKKFSQTKVYNPLELAWAEQLGLDKKAFSELFEATLTRQDIVNSLLPRVTYFGQPISATLSLDTGRLMPIVRLSPENFLLRQFSLTARLRSNALANFVNEFRESGWDAISRVTKERILNGLEENLITSIDIFRNGPVQANMRLYGSKFESTALKFKTDNEWLRYTYRYYSRTNKIIIGQTDEGRNIYAIITGFDEAGKPIYKKVSPNFRDLVGGGYGTSEFRLGKWQTITILPREAGGLKFTMNKGDVGDLLMGMLKWRGSLIEVSRITGLDFESLLEFYNDVQRQVLQNYPARWRGFQDELRNLASIIERGFYDVRDIDSLRAFGRSLMSYQDSLMSDIGDYLDGEILDLVGKVDNRLLSPDIVSQAFIDDINAFYRWWDTKFGASTRPAFVMLDELTDVVPFVYNQADRIIYVARDFAKNWSNLASIRLKAVMGGQFPGGTQAMISNMVHESAHHIRQLMTPTQYARMWETILGSANWARKPPEFLRGSLRGLTKNEIDQQIRQWMRNSEVAKQIAARVSVYATADPAEFFAELLSEATVSNDPSGIARTLIDYPFNLFRRTLRGVQ